MSASTYTESMQRIADEYFDEHGGIATTREIAAWAIRTGRWDAPRDLLIKKCREDLSRALREEYILNEKGQHVRAKHAARITKGDEQLTLWADIRTAKRKHMEIAFQQRRTQIVGDCAQLKRDVDYFNNIHSRKRPIQLVLDFTDDVEEIEQVFNDAKEKLAS